MRVMVTGVTSTHRLCALLAAEPGLQVATVQPRFIDLGEYGITRARPDPSLPYRLFPARVLPVRPYPYSLYLTGFGRALRAFRPDVIYHVGEPSELGTAQLLMMARRTCPQTRTTLFALENVRRRWVGLPKRLRGWAERISLARLDMALAASHTAENLLISQGYPAERVRVVYAGIDPEAFRRVNAPTVRARLNAIDRFLVGFVGRLVYEKGVDLLLEALSRLPERFVLAVVGTGPNETQLRRLACELGVAARVYWMGRIAREELPLYLSAFDALVLPSRSIPVWQEQYGRVLVEAMLCETPVIGSTCGCIPEVIGDAGLTFQEGDPGALAEEMMELAESRPRRIDLAVRGLQRARSHFTERAQVEGLLEAFRLVLELPARRAGAREPSGSDA